jgi:hypothetical protein
MSLDVEGADYKYFWAFYSNSGGQEAWGKSTLYDFVLTLPTDEDGLAPMIDPCK